MMRDLLAGEIPTVLRADLYALAALAAGAIVPSGRRRNSAALPDAARRRRPVCSCGLMAIYRGWRVPSAPWHGTAEAHDLFDVLSASEICRRTPMSKTV